MPTQQAILFTGFEPSGDDHAAAVIRALLAAHPDLRVYAWGGPNMAQAGAQIVHPTGKDAVMGVPGLAKIREHRRINRDIARWLDEHKGQIAAHVPVDSPAANFSICQMAKARGIPVVHLVAPQVWAWASWRVGKLRRLTDHVCCLLPFEEPYFRARRVPAGFVGHPIFDEPLDEVALDSAVAAWPRGSPSVALMPGSRPAEIDHNFPLLLNAFRELAREYPRLRGTVAATRPQVEERLRQLAAQIAPPRGAKPGWPDALDVRIRATDAVVRWADLAMVVSGTVTLQVARQHRPMVIVYKSNPLLYHLVARWIVRTKLFSLPNLIAGREVVPELIPHFGGHEPLLARAVELIERPEVAAAQAEHLRRIAEPFRGHHAAQEAAAAIAKVAGLRVC